MLRVYLLDVSVLQDSGLRAAVSASLSPRRLEKAAAFRRERDRLLSLGAGAALDCALGSAGLGEKDVLLAEGPHGKPFLPERPELFFSLSHGGRFAVCALSDREVGVDVEEIAETREALLRKVCTAEELASLPAGDAEERQNAFFRLWTGKESFLKLLGTGLTLPPREVEVSLGPPPSLGLRGRLQDVSLFWRQPPGHWLSVCVSGREAAGEIAWITLGKKELEERRGSSSSQTADRSF